LLAGCKGGSSKKPVRTGPVKSDVDFAREVFNLMAEGNIAAAEMIDWEHLNVAGMDAGATYRVLGSDAAKENFRKSFINGYSTSFKSSGGNVDAVKSWREQSKDSSKTIVAANGPNAGTLLITITYIDGQQYVSALELK
jgi:hypothetical protein